MKQLYYDRFLRGGHWEVLPKAVSDVKLVFGRGGLVQGLINYLVSAYGNMDAAGRNGQCLKSEILQHG